VTIYKDKSEQYIPECVYCGKPMKKIDTTVSKERTTLLLKI